MLITLFNTRTERFLWITAAVVPGIAAVVVSSIDTSHGICACRSTGNTCGGCTCFRRTVTVFIRIVMMSRGGSSSTGSWRACSMPTMVVIIITDMGSWSGTCCTSSGSVIVTPACDSDCRAFYAFIVNVNYHDHEQLTIIRSCRCLGRHSHCLEDCANRLFTSS